MGAPMPGKRAGPKGRQKAAEALQGLNPADQKRIARAEARDIVRICRQYVPKAVETIVQCLQDPKARWQDRLTASKILIERGYGATPRAEADRAARQLPAEVLEAAVEGLLARRKGQAKQIVDAPAPKAKKR